MCTVILLSLYNARRSERRTSSSLANLQLCKSAAQMQFRKTWAFQQPLVLESHLLALDTTDHNVGSVLRNHLIVM
jgi:hypothetical protein